MPRKNSTNFVLFDLDQTLTDRPASIALMAGKWLQEFGSLLPDCTIPLVCQTMNALDGKGYCPRAEFIAGLLERLPWTKRPDAARLVGFWTGEFPLCAVARSGANRMLDRLVSLGHKIGVVTNGSTASQNRKLDAMGVRPFLSSVVVSETVGVKKPDPRIFQIALDELSAKAETTAFVGDNPDLDILPSRKLGMTAIWLAGVFEWPASEPPPELIIRSLEDLPGLFSA
jgi:putative hydrolase of the HAD superfamily